MAEPHITASPRIEASTLKLYLRNRVEPIFRLDAFMAGLKAHGRITYNNGGTQIDWRPRFRRRTINAGTALPSQISFPVTNTRKKAMLPWRTYDLGETVRKFEKLVGQGKEALFKIASEVMDELADDFIEDLRLRLYVNGYATGSKDMMGLESLFRNSGSLISGSFCAAPNNSYGTLNSTLGNYGGSWTGNWPVGTGDAEYCWWTPLILDTQYASWPSTTDTWTNTWQYVLNAMQTYGEVLQRNKFDFCLLNSELWREAKDSLVGVQKFEVTQRSKLTELGIDVLSFNGLELSTEYGVPSGVGYGLRWKEMELMSMQSQLIDTTNDDDITTSSQLFALDTYLQLRCESPAFFAKLMVITP